MNICEEEAKLNDAQVINLDVTLSNESALKLYEKLCFVSKRLVMRKEVNTEN